MILLYLLITFGFIVWAAAEDSKYGTILAINLEKLLLVEAIIQSIMFILNINGLLILMTGILLIDTLIDIECQEIPNIMNIFSFVLAIIYCLKYGNIYHSLLQLAIYCLLVLIIHFLLNFKNDKLIMGGGDLKLFPSIFICLNYYNLLTYIIILCGITLIAYPILRIKKIETIAFAPYITIAFIVYLIFFPEVNLLF